MTSASVFQFRPYQRSEEDQADDLAWVGTCQRCGAYWDVRLYPVCPCGGEVL